MTRPRTLAGRLFAWLALVVLVVLLTLGIVLDRVLERDTLDALTSSLSSQARTIQQATAGETQNLQQTAGSFGEAGGVRITIVTADGMVLADSEHDPATMENHAGRPEIRTALSGQVGVASRRSETLGTDFLYVALPPEEGRIVRVALPLTTVQARRTRVRLAVAIGLVAAAVAAAAGSLLVSRNLSRPLRQMTASLERLADGDLEARVEPDGPDELRVLATTLNTMAERLAAEIGGSREAQQTRDLILSSMEDGVLLTDPGGRVTFANRALEQHLDSSPATVNELSPVALRRAVADAAAGHGAAPVETEVGAPGRWLRGSAVAVDEHGSVLLILRDVTQAKRLDAVRRDFVANASHELKTPAAAIQAAAETLKSAAESDPSAVPRFADQLEREAIRLARIVSDLLDLSRLESGSELAEDVAMDEIVRDETARAAGLAERHKVALRVEVAPTKVRGSAHDLALLARNLVDNAIRYSRPGGKVGVTLASENGEVVIRVNDNGIGIPSRDLPRIFERFYRVDRARSRETGGTGLGLSIVKHVAENHGGRVGVRSELGSGSEFEVRLPSAG